VREKVVKGGIALVVRQTLSLPVNALGVIFASRLLTPTDFGAQAFIIPLSTLAMTLADLGTSQALVQSAEEAEPALLRKVQFLKLLGGVLSILVFSVLSPWVLRHFALPSSFTWLFPACGFLGWLQSQRAYQAVGLQRQVNWQLLARIEMMEIIVYNVALVVSAYLLRSAWCFVLALSTRYVIGAILLRISTQPQTISFSSSLTLNSLLRFGVPLQATSLFGIVNGLVNPVVVGSLVGLHAVGIINWSAYIVSLPMLPLQPLPNFLFSVLSERRRQGRNDNDLLANMTYIGSIAISLLSLWIVLSMEWLVMHIFGAQWREAIPIVSILILSNLIWFPTHLIVSQLTSHGYSRVWFMTNLLGTVLLWITAGLGTIYLGTMGYALGWLVASFIPLVVLSGMAQSRTGLNVPWLDSLYLMLSFVCALGISRFVTGIANLLPFYSILLNLSVGSLVFISAVWLLGRLRKINWLGIFSLVWKRGAHEVSGLR
jgi:PST family polysaccharide transporter